MANMNRHNICKYVILIFLCTLFSLPVFAQTEIGGYYKNEVMWLGQKSGDGILADVNRFRLKMTSQLTPIINFYAEPEYVILAKTQEIPLANVSELNKVVFDRLYVKINFPMTDVTIGKQRIAWGTSYLWNPTDIFNSFQMTFAVAEEEFRGVDAIRIQVPLDAASDFDMVMLTNEREISETNIGLYDLSFSSVDLSRGSYQNGFDFSGEYGDIGLRGEIAFIHLVGFAEYSKMALGGGYTFDNGVGVDLEYFYNGQGAESASGYDWAGLFAGNVSYLARQYLYIGTNYALDELSSVSTAVILNSNDGGFIFYPAYSKNISQNIDISFELMFPGGGEGTEYNPSSAQDPTGLLGGRAIFMKVKNSF